MVATAAAVITMAVVTVEDQIMVETEIVVTDKDTLVVEAMVIEEGLEEVIVATIEMGGIEMVDMGKFH